jgi:zinc D-Ala-D-Ala carboxypeptidase
MNDFKYFTLSEFACKCGRCHLNKIDPLLIMGLDKAREIAGTPFVITSGYRCTGHNAQVGGAPTSSHLIGLAADIATGGSFERRFRILFGLLGAGFNRIGIANGFIHADIDRTKAQGVVWLYK